MLFTNLQTAEIKYKTGGSYKQKTFTIWSSSWELLSP